MRSQRRRVPYSRESIIRALQHHELTGAIRSYSPPYTGRPAWIVTGGFGSPLDRHEFTTPAVHAFCLGLAEAERRWRGELDRTNAGGRDETCGCDDGLSKELHCPSCFAHVGPPIQTVERCPACREVLNGSESASTDRGESSP